MWLERPHQPLTCTRGAQLARLQHIHRASPEPKHKAALRLSLRRDHGLWSPASASHRRALCAGRRRQPHTPALANDAAGSNGTDSLSAVPGASLSAVRRPIVSCSLNWAQHTCLLLAAIQLHLDTFLVHLGIQYAARRVRTSAADCGDDAAETRRAKSIALDAAANPSEARRPTTPHATPASGERVLSSVLRKAPTARPAPTAPTTPRLDVGCRARCCRAALFALCKRNGCHND